MVLNYIETENFVLHIYLQIVGRGNDQVAITTKFETRDDMCEFIIQLFNFLELHFCFGGNKGLNV